MIENWKTQYKYSVTMKPNFNTVKHIKGRISSMYKEFRSKKLEILLSSLYENNYQYYWHPIFDFDSVNVTEIKSFLRNEISDIDNTYIEITKNGFHIVVSTAYGPITNYEIKQLREKTKNMFIKEYITYDWKMSLVITPIRRTFCYYTTASGRNVISCIDAKTFLNMKYKEIFHYKKTFVDVINEKIFNSIINNVLFPTRSTRKLSDILARF